MDLSARFTRHFEESARLKVATAAALAQPLAAATERMVQALLNNGKILACGNGGSAGDAQHFAAELLNRFEVERPGLAAMALTTDSSTLTSIANDYSFDQVFSKQVRALGQAGDVLLAISTSGNSPNVIRAMDVASERGLKTICLLGKGGGKLAGRADLEWIIAPAAGDTLHADRIQEIHMLILHNLVRAIELRMFGK